MAPDTSTSAAGVVIVVTFIAGLTLLFAAVANAFSAYGAGEALALGGPYVGGTVACWSVAAATELRARGLRSWSRTWLRACAAALAVLSALALSVGATVLFELEGWAGFLVLVGGWAQLSILALRRLLRV